jgi:hypothetical protein
MLTRTRRRGHHAHLDAEVLQLLLDHARGHLERFGRHGLDAAGGGIEQVHLRQLGVQRVSEERLLALLGHAVGLRHLDHRLLDDDRRVHLAALAAGLHHMIALALGHLAQALVFGTLALLLAVFAHAIEPHADRIGQSNPREAQRERHAHHQRHDPADAGAGEPKPLHAQRPKHRTEHAAGTGRQIALPAVQARPFERAARGHQQHHTAPERNPMVRRQILMPRQAPQSAEPRAQANQRQPPDRPAEHEQCGVGHPGTGQADRVVRHLANA